jgi:hypothetical protein
MNDENPDGIRLPIELFIIEILYVSVSVIFETICIYAKDYTPGKYMLNLRVLSCQRVIEHPVVNGEPGQYLLELFPGQKLSFKS